MIYCIDTSSLLTGWIEHYPPEVFPGLWKHFEELIKIGTVIAPEEVYFELEKQDDSIKIWVDYNKKMFQPLDDELQNIAKGILAKYPTLIDLDRPTYQADPFVIALAIKRNATVVTQETWTNSPYRTKIPNVCASYNIECINLLKMLRNLKVEF
ncbi:MAG: DUF4411 family protein [Candidatus Methanoperedens sp.]|nr:DUF4411 family protein [Candidatus Methanoperedens sp.]